MAMFEQLDRATNILISAYLHNMFYANKIIKSGTFQAASNIEELERKIVYFMKNFIIRGFEREDLLNKVSRISIRNNNLIVSYDYIPIGFNPGYDIQAIIGRLMTGAYQDILARQDFLAPLRMQDNELDHRWINVSNNIHSVSIYVSPLIWRNPINHYSALELNLLVKCELIYNILVGLPDVGVEATKYRTKCATMVNNDGTINTDYRFNLRELYHILKPIHTAQIYERMFRNPMREALLNLTMLHVSGIPLQETVYLENFNIADDLVRGGSRRPAPGSYERIVEWNQSIKTLCEYHGLTPTILGG